MKVIFLDIDGVLVNRASCELPPVRCSTDSTAARAHPDCVAALNQVTAATEAMLVLSSDWRIFGIGFMREWIGTCGVEARLVAMTPVLHGRERGDEIREWLKQNRYRVESFVILDDHDDSNMRQLLPRLVKTDSASGLTAHEAKQAISLFSQALP